MEIRDRVAVVTGGASGIGRSLCLAFAEHGAAGVVVADVDTPGAEDVAAQVISRGGRALAVRADLTREGDVRALVGQATDAFGRIDLFCSNAGIIVAGGVEVSDEAWSRIWAVNVQSHVYAARAVLPGMLARGDGYLVHHGVGGRPADPAWLGALRGDQARGRRAGRVARHHLRRPGHQGVAACARRRSATNLGATSLREVGALALPPPGDGAIPSSDAGSVSRQAAVDGVLTADQVAASVVGRAGG